MNSLNFKDKYKSCQDKIVPDKDFLDRLEKQMEQEQQKQKKINYSHKSHNIYFRICAAAAAVCIIIGGALFVKNNMNNSVVEQDSSVSRKDTNVKAGNENSIEDKLSFNKGEFSQKNLLENESSKTKKLAEILDEEETTVYKSGEENFSFDDKINEEEKKELSEKVKDYTEKTSEKSAGNTTYYMAVTKSGDTVKFEISDEKYLKIKGFEEIYKK